MKVKVSKLTYDLRSEYCSGKWCGDRCKLERLGLCDIISEIYRSGFKDAEDFIKKVRNLEIDTQEK